MLLQCSNFVRERKSLWDRKEYSIPLIIMGKGPDGKPIRDLKGNIIMVYAPYYRGAGAGKGKRPSRSK